ncbi:hypothetical protein DH2020_001183 [Rehmannia glutinosa]|uniref:BHLH domain-containing protein n=1 Tax=Rehmannia glutinosa TaxID=99300 RepID=A0ABR0XYY1_REHGL
MNDLVPDFHEIEDDYLIPNSSGFPDSKSLLHEDEIMELLWQNGQVVVRKSSQNKPPFVYGGRSGGDAVIPAVVREIRASGAEEPEQHLFMEEDEMASWLQYPDDSSFGHDLYEDLFCSSPPPEAPVTTTVAPPRAVAEIRPPPSQNPEIFPRLQNFTHFSRLSSKPRIEPVAKPSVTASKESTAAEPNVNPTVRLQSRFSHTVADRRAQVNTESGTVAAVRCELTLTSSPGASDSNFSASAVQRPPKQKAETSAAAEDRKRKGREADDDECQSEDDQFEGGEAKKQACGSASSSKRSRAAQVHNLSERRRRDRINEKMKALQELIPRSNKSDKASMLDEAIEYLKSLQLQIQMMSMGYGMVPMMHPGMQQYMPMMGMGMNMQMGMNPPMVPYPSMLPGSAMPNPAAFHLPQVPSPDPSRILASNNQTDPMLNSLVACNLNEQHVQNFANPYQQFLGPHQAQLPLPKASLIPKHRISHADATLMYIHLA